MCYSSHKCMFLPNEVLFKQRGFPTVYDLLPIIIVTTTLYKCGVFSFLCCVCVGAVGFALMLSLFDIGFCAPYIGATVCWFCAPPMLVPKGTKTLTNTSKRHFMTTCYVRSTSLVRLLTDLFSQLIFCCCCWMSCSYSVIRKRKLWF